MPGQVLPWFFLSGWMPHLCPLHVVPFNLPPVKTFQAQKLGDKDIRIICQNQTGCCPKTLAIALRVMLPESSLVLMNISHLRCGPVGVRFMRLRRIYRTRNDGRHKCRPYKDLKRKFLYYQVIKLEVTLLCKLALGNSLSRADSLSLLSAVKKAWIQWMEIERLGNSFFHLWLLSPL